MSLMMSLQHFLEVIIFQVSYSYISTMNITGHLASKCVLGTPQNKWRGPSTVSSL